MKTTPWPLDGEVHLHCLALPQHTSELARLGGLLAPSETERAGSLKSELAMRSYIAGRGVLREILGGYLGVDAKKVQLATGEHGKPFLMDVKENLCFNLSHSEDNFLLAVSVNREVGIDIERIVSGKSLGDMARLVFSRDEQDQLSRLSSPHREVAFCRCWVRKEACLKACGRGFSLPGNNFEVSSLDEESAVTIARCNQQYWHVLDLKAPPGFCAALAVESHCSIQSKPSVFLL
jgi:4'-phosphopantetheinyl transferase